MSTSEVKLGSAVREVTGPGPACGRKYDEPGIEPVLVLCPQFKPLPHYPYRGGYVDNKPNNKQGSLILRQALQKQEGLGSSEVRAGIHMFVWIEMRGACKVSPSLMPDDARLIGSINWLLL